MRGLTNFTRRTGDGEFVSRKGGGGSKEAVLEVVLDGYSAPLTAGHFAQLVEENYYNNATIAGCDKCSQPDFNPMTPPSLCPPAPQSPRNVKCRRACGGCS